MLGFQLGNEIRQPTVKSPNASGSVKSDIFLYNQILHHVGRQY